MLLIISASELDGIALSEIFHFMGIVNRSVSPARAFSEISNIYHSVLIAAPNKLADTEDFVRAIRRLSLGAKVFAIADKSSYTLVKSSALFDEVFIDNTFSSVLYSRMNEIIAEDGGRPIGEYRLAGIDASAALDGVYYFGKKVKLTKTETMILRYLICTYPSPVDTRDILLHAFRQGRIPEPSNVRTHISSINKKFRLISGKSIIISTDRAGYAILTPEREANLLLV